jgi:circadian clock protein KaiC
MKYCTSGIMYLDEILCGGLPKPSLIMVAGTAGAGKTTFILQSLSKAAENGEKVVYIPITTQSVEKLTDYLHVYPFFNNNIMIHPLDRSTAEKDPLSMLMDIKNILTSTNPDRIAVNPLSALGFGFAPNERHRFFYSFDTMLQNWSAQTLITAELSKSEVQNSILSHIADGVIHLDRKNRANRLIRTFEIKKLRGMGNAIHDPLASYEFKISSDGFCIFPKLKTATDVQPVKEFKLTTGVEGLDDMMYGGIPEKSTLLVIGKTGLGKTMLGLQFIVAGLKLGEAGVIVMFDEREDQLIYEARRLGWDLKRFIDKGLLRIIHSHPQNISPDEHNLKIVSCLEEVGAKRLLFDDVHNMESVIPDPVELRDHIRLLTNFLKSKGVTVMLTNETSEQLGSEKLPKLGITSVADAIILLHFQEDHDRFDRVLSILKLRGSDHDKSKKKYIIRDNGIKVV